MNETQRKYSVSSNFLLSLLRKKNRKRNLCYQETWSIVSIKYFNESRLIRDPKANFPELHGLREALIYYIVRERPIKASFTRV